MGTKKPSAEALARARKLVSVFRGAAGNMWVLVELGPGAAIASPGDVALRRAIIHYLALELDAFAAAAPVVAPRHKPDEFLSILTGASRGRRASGGRVVRRTRSQTAPAKAKKGKG